MDERPPAGPPSLFDPRIFATVTLIVIHLSLLTAIALVGGGVFVGDPAMLVRYGALVRPLVWDDHQYWRLISAMFLHADLPHILINAFCLFVFGCWLEVGLGHVRYLALYLAAGLTGNLASLLLGPPEAVSVGASGAIFGVVVAYLIMALCGPIHWTDVVRQPAPRTLFFLFGIMLALGFIEPAIDSLAHLGGAATGAVWGFFFLARSEAAGGSPHRRWIGMALWGGVVGGMCAMAFQQPKGAACHIGAGAYYLFADSSGDGRSKALAHFDKAADNPEQALKALDRVVARQPYMTRQHRFARRLQLLDSLDIDAAAVEHYHKQVKRRPSGDGLRLLAALLMEPAVADYQGALAACGEGAKEFPKERYWSQVEAQIHANFRQFDKALALLGPLEGTSQSKSVEDWYLAALCYVRRHQSTEAERATSRCLALGRPTLPSEVTEGMRLEVKQWRCRTLKELGRAKEAEATRAEMETLWRRRSIHTDDRATGLNNLAWFLATTDGDLDEALRLANQSVELGAEAYNLDTLAWVQHRRGDHEAAWATMARTLALRRSNAPEYHYHAGAILFALERKREARKFLEKAIAPGVDFEEFEDAERLLAADGR